MQLCNPVYMTPKDYSIGGSNLSSLRAWIVCFLPLGSSYIGFWKVSLAGIFSFPQRNVKQTLLWSRTTPEWAAALQWPWADYRKPEGRGACLGKGTQSHLDRWVPCCPPCNASLLTAQDKFVSVPKSKRWLRQRLVCLLHTGRRSLFSAFYSSQINILSSSPYSHLHGINTDSGLMPSSLRPSNPLKL